MLGNTRSNKSFSLPLEIIDRLQSVANERRVSASSLVTDALSMFLAIEPEQQELEIKTTLPPIDVRQLTAAEITDYKFPFAMCEALLTYIEENKPIEDQALYDKAAFIIALCIKRYEAMREPSDIFLEASIIRLNKCGPLGVSALRKAIRQYQKEFTAVLYNASQYQRENSDEC
jgi:hypothetical protein